MVTGDRAIRMVGLEWSIRPKDWVCGCEVVLGNRAWSLRLLRRAGIKCDKDVMVVQFLSKLH